MSLIELLSSVLKSFFQSFLSFFNPIFLIPIIIAIIIFIKKNIDYKKSSYNQITKLPYLAVMRDIGKYGEYLTYKYLKKFEINGAKFLFNLYIPKENDETTEIDVLMISEKGLFVFESKNYSGWIFGNETQKNWYQTLPKGRGKSHKESFYNPILQNKNHIKHLKIFLNEEIPIWSIIVFSERCTLKNVQVNSDINVINRNDVYSIISDIYNKTEETLLTEAQIVDIYDKLYPFTQVDTNTKAQHIINIQNEITYNKPSNTDTTEKMHNQTINLEIRESNDTTNASTSSKIQEETILKCPKCGSNLVLRTASKGANTGKQFYGCSNFPKCKYIRKL